MPPTTRIIPIVALALAFGAPSGAQEAPKPLPEPRTVPGLASRSLLEEPAVQREIGMTEKQRTNLVLLQDEYQANRGAAGADLGEEGFDFNAMMGQTDELDALHRAAVGKILTAAQKNRLNQLEWQREGWPALARPDVAKKVNLSNPQQQKIRAIVEAMRRDQAFAGFTGAPADPRAAEALKNLNPANGFVGNPEALLPDGGPMQRGAENPQAKARQADETATKARVAAGREVADLLKPDQRAAFDRLLGPPFDFARLDAPQPPPSRPTPKAGKSAKNRPTGR